jgi:hypothetical protein
MRLSFNEHMSAKTRRDVRLQVFPSGEPKSYLTERQERESGESTAWSYEYDFPDDLVVVAYIEFGGAVIMPDEPVTTAVEVHIGPEAAPAVIASAETEAKKLAANAGINEDTERIPGYSGLQIIKH